MRKWVVFMKKVWKMAVCGLVCAMAFCGCGTSESVSEEANADRVVKKEFADPVFEKYLRSALGNLGGELTEGELGAIKQIGFDPLGYAMGITYESYSDGYVDYDTAIPVPYETTETNSYHEEELRIQSLEDLRMLPNLEAVYLMDDDYDSVVFKNFNFVKDLPHLKELSGEYAGTSLEPLKHCKELETLRLDMATRAVTDFSPLSQCTSLKNLDLNWALENEEAASVLENCTQVELLSFRLSDSAVLDLEPLKNFPNLKHLAIYDGTVENIDVLLELPNLEDVTLTCEGEEPDVIKTLLDSGVGVGP